MARAVRWDLIADPRKYQKGFRDAEQTTKQFHGTVKKTAIGIGAAFAGIQVGSFLRDSINEAREAAKVTRQTNAVIKATGGVANVTAKDVDRLAGSLSTKVGVDDEVIAAGENMLLTFKGVANQAGKNNDIFNQATTVAVDLAAATNQGVVTQENLEKANIRLGKALQDPIKGVSALTKVGVTFTDQQKAQIKTLVESGKTMDAQKIILGELKSEFGGAAEAAADPWTKLSVTFGNVKETIGTALLPALEDIVNVVGGVALAFIDLNEATGGWATKGLLAAAGAVALGVAFVKVTGFIQEAKAAWVAYRTATLEAAAANKVAGSSFVTLGAYGAAAGVALGTLAFNVKEFKEKGLEKGRFLDPASLALKTLGGWLGITTDKTKKQADTTDAAKQVADDYAKAMEGVGGAQANTAAKTEELKGKLEGLKGEFAAQKQAVQDSIEAYDGLIAKSDVTAKDVIGDLHNQVANFKTYSKDVQRLIKAGVDPKAIQELSQKGPQFIHALATGSAKQLGEYKRTWDQRNKEVRGGFAKSMQSQLSDLQDKIKKMQREIDRLHGKTVSITGVTSMSFTKNFSAKDWAAARIAAGAPGSAARGMLVTNGTGPTADDVPIWVSKGEAVVPANLVPAVAPFLSAHGVPGFARGGYPTTFGQVDQAHTGVGRIMDRAGTLQMAALIKKLMSGAGSPAIKAWIRAQDPKPYVWAAAGPGAFDCSGIVSAVLGKMLGMPGAGSGLRLFTTGTIGAGQYGLRSGLGGTLQIGVTPGRGHMAGRYGGLGFEAESSRTGIKIGSAASPPSSFARHYYHMAKGGRITRALLAAYATAAGSEIGGDPGHLRINGQSFDRGGWLRPGFTMAYNGTGRAEPVGAGGGGLQVTVDLRGATFLGSAASIASELAPKMRQALRDAQRSAGVPAAQQIR